MIYGSVRGFRISAWSWHCRVAFDNGRGISIGEGMLEMMVLKLM